MERLYRALESLHTSEQDAICSLLTQIVTKGIVGILDSNQRKFHVIDIKCIDGIITNDEIVNYCKGTGSIRHPILPVPGKQGMSDGYAEFFPDKDEQRGGKTSRSLEQNGCIKLVANDSVRDVPYFTYRLYPRVKLTVKRDLRRSNFTPVCPEPEPQFAEIKTEVRWQYKEIDVWCDYEKEHQNTIEKCYQDNNSGLWMDVIKSNFYTIFFKTMKQVNDKTKTKRDVRRR